MIQLYIKNAIKDIEQLIDLTKKDIRDIQDANYDNISKRVTKKNHLAISFETHKSLLDDELSKKAKNNPLENTLDNSDRKLLEELKTKLSKLKKKNREYAKYIVKLSNFYTSLFDRTPKSSHNSYKIADREPATIPTASV
jgi:hypothetical protein